MSRIDGRQVMVRGAWFGAQVFKNHGCSTSKCHGAFLHDFHGLNNIRTSDLGVEPSVGQSPSDKHVFMGVRAKGGRVCGQTMVMEPMGVRGRVRNCYGT